MWRVWQRRDLVRTKISTLAGPSRYLGGDKSVNLFYIYDWLFRCCCCHHRARSFMGLLLIRQLSLSWAIRDIRLGGPRRTVLIRLTCFSRCVSSTFAKPAASHKCRLALNSPRKWNLNPLVTLSAPHTNAAVETSSMGVESPEFLKE